MGGSPRSPPRYSERDPDRHRGPPSGDGYKLCIMVVFSLGSCTRFFCYLREPKFSTIPPSSCENAVGILAIRASSQPDERALYGGCVEAGSTGGDRHRHSD